MRYFSVDELRTTASIARRIMLDIGYQSNYAVHFGGGLSSIDLLSYLYQSEMNYNINDKINDSRDRFYLSKGHGVLSYYVALYQAGFFDKRVLDTFQQNDSDLASHPTRNLELGVEASTGSLGQGLSLAVGSQLYAKLNKKNFRSIVLMGDGESNEGSVWEAAMSAAHYGLGDLVAIIDYNKLQSDGKNEMVMNLLNLSDKWISFGWDVYEINGHDFDEMHEAFMSMDYKNNKPKCLIAHTVKGKGISFMENNNEWHHRMMTEEEYNKAVEELEGSNWK